MKKNLKGLKPLSVSYVVKKRKYANSTTSLRDHITRCHADAAFNVYPESTKPKGPATGTALLLRLSSDTDSPYKCTDCPKSFTIKYDLNSHMQTHTRMFL